jgi:hypothetical protein
MDLRNGGTLPQQYTVSQPRRSRLEILSLSLLLLLLLLLLLFNLK